MLPLHGRFVKSVSTSATLVAPVRIALKCAPSHWTKGPSASFTDRRGRSSGLNITKLKHLLFAERTRVCAYC